MRPGCGHRAGNNHPLGIRALSTRDIQTETLRVFWLLWRDTHYNNRAPPMSMEASQNARPSHPQLTRGWGTRWNASSRTRTKAIRIRTSPIPMFVSFCRSWVVTLAAREQQGNRRTRGVAEGRSRGDATRQGTECNAVENCHIRFEVTSKSAAQRIRYALCRCRRFRRAGRRLLRVHVLAHRRPHSVGRCGDALAFFEHVLIHRNPLR